MHMVFATHYGICCQECCTQSTHCWIHTRTVVLFPFFLSFFLSFVRSFVRSFFRSFVRSFFLPFPSTPSCLPRSFLPPFRNWFFDPVELILCWCFSPLVVWLGPLSSKTGATQTINWQTPPVPCSVVIGLATSQSLRAAWSLWHGLPNSAPAALGHCYVRLSLAVRWYCSTPPQLEFTVNSVREFAWHSCLCFLDKQYAYLRYMYVYYILSIFVYGW